MSESRIIIMYCTLCSMQQKKPVPHKEEPTGDLYAMPDKKKDVSHTSGPVTGDEYALAFKPKVRKYLIFVCVSPISHIVTPYVKVAAWP